MRKFWILDQHGGEGPTALVRTDGRLRIVDIIEFGPGITSVKQQQELWDRLMGGLAPTMKPLVDASTLQVDGEPPDDKLRRGSSGDDRSKSQAGPARAGSRGRQASGPSRNRSRGER